MRFPAPIRRAGAIAGGLAAIAGGLAGAARRRKESRQPRVRVRIAHGETRLLAPDSPERERLLEVANALVSEYRKVGRAR
jgi:hypothetical protein